MPAVFPHDGVARDRDGIPKILGSLRTQLRSGCTKTFKFVVSALQLSYKLKGSKTPVLKEIIKPSSNSLNSSDFRVFVRDFKKFLPNGDLPE
jgi:hypothetical protein